MALAKPWRTSGLGPLHALGSSAGRSNLGSVCSSSIHPPPVSQLHLRPRHRGRGGLSPLRPRPPLLDSTGRRYVPVKLQEPVGASALALPGRGTEAARVATHFVQHLKGKCKKYKNKTSQRYGCLARADPQSSVPQATVHLTLTSGLISIGLSCIFANCRRTLSTEKSENSKRSRPGCCYKAPA